MSDDPELDHLGYPIATKPHPLAWWEPNWRSRHGPKPEDGWAFWYRCKAGCPDAIGSTPATFDPETYRDECPDCGGPCEIFNPGSPNDQR